jgi:hypothetical protein
MALGSATTREYTNRLSKRKQVASLRRSTDERG